MESLLKKKKYLLIVGMALCCTSPFFGKTKDKFSPAHTHVSDAPSQNSAIDTITPRDPFLYKSPLVKECLALAESYHQEKNYDKAINFYTKTLSMDQYNFNALKGIATISFMQKEFNRAAEYYETIIHHYPRCVSGHYNIGLCFLQNKQYAKASGALKKAVSLDPEHYKAWYALATCLEGELLVNESFDAYKKTIDLRPTFSPAHHRIGILYKNINDYPKAIHHLQQALEIEKNNLHIMMELGNIFNMIDEHEKALTLYVSILKTDPFNLTALYNCGFTLKKQNRLDEALAVYERVIELDPLYAKAHFSRAHVLLSQGNFIEGFKEYEWRFETHDHPCSPYTIPMWDGSDLTNKTILVRAEQSIDDTIQFARYIPLLQALGARVIFQVQNNLKQLFQCSSNLGTVIDYSQNPPFCDFQISLMSLAYILKTTSETIPTAHAYLSADKNLIAYWRSYLAHNNNLKIGIYWQDGATKTSTYCDQKNSIPLSLFSQLSSIPHVSLYSLHRIDKQRDLPECIKSFGAHFDTIHGPFMDSAAIVGNLDLVISFDGAIGHLSAALGAPTWIILSQDADWRWLINRGDSPWYPTVCLFRQTKNYDWSAISSSLMHQVALRAQEKKQQNDIARFDTLNTLSLSHDAPLSVPIFADSTDDNFLQELQRNLSLIVNNKS